MSNSMARSTLGSRAICTLSGGYDSAAALLWALDLWPTEALFITYGQPYEQQERRAITYLASECPRISKHPNFLGVRTVNADLSLMAPGNPWIPYRNLVIAALATNVAATTGSDIIVFGSKSAVYRPDDPISYMDSTVGFYDALALLVHRFTEPKNQPTPHFCLPLVNWNKKEVLRAIHSAGIDLRRLWNCYRGNDQNPCGECEHCTITQPLVESVIRELSDADATGAGSGQ